MTKFDFGGRMIPPTEFPVPVPSRLVNSEIVKLLDPIPWNQPLIANLILRAIRSHEFNLAQDMLKLYSMYQPEVVHLWDTQLCTCCGYVRRRVSLSPFIAICATCEYTQSPDLHSWTLESNLRFLTHKLTPEFTAVLATALMQLSQLP